jgi:hypothetical protein
VVKTEVPSSKVIISISLFPQVDSLTPETVIVSTLKDFIDDEYFGKARIVIASSQDVGTIEPEPTEIGAPELITILVAAATPPIPKITIIAVILK